MREMKNYMLYKNKVIYRIYKMSRNAINVGFIDIGTVVELLVGLPTRRFFYKLKCNAFKTLLSYTFKFKKLDTT